MVVDTAIVTENGIYSFNLAEEIQASSDPLHPDRTNIFNSTNSQLISLISCLVNLARQIRFEDALANSTSNLKSW